MSLEELGEALRGDEKIFSALLAALPAPALAVLTLASYLFLALEADWAPFSVTLRVVVLGSGLTALFVVSEEGLGWRLFTAAALTFSVSLDVTAQLSGWYAAETGPGALRYDFLAHGLAGFYAALYLTNVLKVRGRCLWALCVSALSLLLWEAGELAADALAKDLAGGLIDFTYTLENSLWDGAAHMGGTLAALAVYSLYTYTHRGGSVAEDSCWVRCLLLGGDLRRCPAGPSDGAAGHLERRERIKKK
jgi:hypothetical protein